VLILVMASTSLILKLKKKQGCQGDFEGRLEVLLTLEVATI